MAGYYGSGNSFSDKIAAEMKERAKKLVKVMTPIPPIWIRNMMMICPVCVNVVATSTVVSPVTQTEVVEMNRASTK